MNQCPMQTQFTKIKQLAERTQGAINTIAKAGHTFLACSTNAPAEQTDFKPPHIYFEYACPPEPSHFDAFCVNEYGAFNKAFQDHKSSILAPLQAIAANDYAGLCGKYANIKGIIGEAIKLHSSLAGDEETPDSFARFNKYYAPQLNMGASHEHVTNALRYGGRLAGKVRSLNHLFELISDTYDELCNPSTSIAVTPGKKCKCGGAQYIQQIEKIISPDPKGPSSQVYYIQKTINIYAFSIGNSFAHFPPGSINDCGTGGKRNIVVYKPDYTVKTQEYKNMLNALKTLGSIQEIVSQLGLDINCNPEVQAKAAAISDNLGSFAQRITNFPQLLEDQFPTTALGTIINKDPGVIINGVIKDLRALINAYYSGCPKPKQKI